MRQRRLLGSRIGRWAWYAFDMGNSAHALLVSTVGFSLFFKEYLYASNPKADSIWGAVTSIILILSAIGSPLIASWTYGIGRRHIGLWITTVVCIGATAALATPLCNNPLLAITAYIVSALGYYLALPIYNSYLESIPEGKMQKVSGTGWGLGYFGGILAAAICYVLGFLNAPVAERPDLYRLIFLVAAMFNLVLSLPILLLASIGSVRPNHLANTWTITRVIETFTEFVKAGYLRLLVVYWLIGEGAVVVTYYFAIYLSQYGGLQIKQIMLYSILGQVLAAGSTIAAGWAATKIGWKQTLIGVIVIWIAVPVTLFSITEGLSVWVPIISISLVIGAYHSLVRGKIAGVANSFADKGSVFGFLEVSGRMSQVLGPFLIFLASLLLPLKYAILGASVFPIVALIVIKRYE